MFDKCKSLTSIDVTNFDTHKVKEMFALFRDCIALTSIDLSNFNTSNAHDLQRMFVRCKSLTSLDLTKFKTSKATNMTYMFSECENLETIMISNGWNTDSVTAYTGIFNKCPKLKGGKGTVFDQNMTGIEYAHADEGESNPGYLTLAADAWPVFITDAGMATMYFDQPLTIPTGVEAWYCRSINDESCIVLAYPIFNTIPANTGVFLTGDRGGYLFERAADEPAIDKNILVGSMTDTEVEYKSVLTLGHDQEGKLGFWYFTGTTIPAEKAYIPEDVVSRLADAPRAAARSYTVVFNEEGENQTTGISNVAVEKRNDGKIYNLNGQQVKNPTKGLYIVNGKKVILK